jgi:hypothetical protein
MLEIIIFMWGNPNLAHLKGWAMKILTFKGGPRLFGPLLNGLLPKSRLLEGLRLFWPLKGTSHSEGHFEAKKVEAPL